MKGIILAGGNATRLRPLTLVTSKQLLPVYNKPMIFYPLQTLLDAGIRDILVIVAPTYAGHFLHLLGSGKAFNARITYEIQEEPRGLADAFIIGEDFMDEDSVTMILGDNIFPPSVSKQIADFDSGGRVFAYKVPDPERYGVVKFDEQHKAVQIEEKPSEWISDYAITGLYVYDKRVAQFAKEVKPSERGEIEITELHKRYLALGELDVRFVDGEWFDAGTFDSLLDASNHIAAQQKRS
ncbi:MAG: NTP transferase domain-containing protein [Candidatus Kerfeldbacteria bacterium]|nr:NTP transferase domain-containing protein [Candidatus Kerfeldbacteria bacterium]